MNKKIVIIGAGLSGLSAGIRLAQYGYDTTILEMSTQPGGMCTSWIRDGYTFDGCIAWMVGSGDGQAMNSELREIGAISETTKIYPVASTYLRIDENTYQIPFELASFRKFLCGLSEADSNKVKHFCDELEAVMAVDMAVALKKSNPAAYVLAHHKKAVFVLLKYWKVSVSKLCSSFQCSLVREIFNTLLPEHFSTAALLITLAQRMTGNAGYPLHGSAELAKQVEKKYLNLGGKIVYNEKALQIKIENGAATTVICKNKSYLSDAVIAACDAHEVLYDLLDRKYHHAKLYNMLKNASLFEPILLFSFGVCKRFGLPHKMRIKLREPLETAPNNYESYITLRSFEFDSSSAPLGCSSITVRVKTVFNYWFDLRTQDKSLYQTKKETLIAKILLLLNSLFGDFSNYVKVTDLATPATYVRYANLYHSSWEGFEPTPKYLQTKISHKIKGIENFYLCGQWLKVGGGIGVVVKDGLSVAEHLDNDFKRWNQ